jgi:hypothetical protein
MHILICGNADTRFLSVHTAYDSTPAHHYAIPGRTLLYLV